MVEIDIFKTIETAILIGIIGFIGWLIKKSIYGEFADIRKSIATKQPSSECRLEMEVIKAKFEGEVRKLYSKINDNVLAIKGNTDLLVESVNNLNEKIFDHIKGK